MAKDKMRLELLLAGKDNLSSVIKKQSSHLKQFDRDANKAANSLKKLLELKPAGNLKSPFADFAKKFFADVRKTNTEAEKLRKNLDTLFKAKSGAKQKQSEFLDKNPKSKDASLKVKDQLSPVLKNQIALLKVFRREVEDADKSLAKLFKQRKFSSGGFAKQFVSEFGKVNSEADKLKKKLQSIGNVKIKTPKIAAPSLSDSDFSPKTKQGQRDELDRLFNRNQKNRNVVERLSRFNDSVVEPARQTKDVWRREADSLKPYTDEATRLLRVQERFKLINLPEAENQKVFRAVQENARNVKGISLADSQEIFTSLFNTLGNPDAAIQALPMASKYKVATSAIYGDIFSPEEINSQIQKGFKYLELTGATKDRATMEQRFDTITKIANSTGGEAVSFDKTSRARRPNPE